MKKILLLGSTGSIGTSTIQCVRRFSNEFSLVGLAAATSVAAIVQQSSEFGVTHLALADESAARAARELLGSSVTVLSGETGMLQLVNDLDYDILLNALVGAAGFRSTIAALRRNKRVALANKESLVVGGDLITTLLAQGQGTLLPVDSEHSAILQCLNGEQDKAIESITVTASGGPFRKTEAAAFGEITPEKALNHPTWSMGPKITIDSSTLVNKGFEVIEAHYLFSVPYDRITVLVHPQSIVHSMVTFHDGSVMAQCGLPDMELPIQYALSYPERLPISAKRLDLAAIGALTFEYPDYNRFKGLRLCIEAGKTGGTALTVLNAANEIAVDSFLKKQIPFTAIADVIDEMLAHHVNSAADSVEKIIAVDEHIRKQARDFIQNRSKI